MLTQESIDIHLRRLESQERFEILFACESGSRAWGFPSPDSDYDVRFIYVRPLREYLRLSPLRDNVNGFLDDNVFDYSGWDMGKTLKLFMAGNTSLYEWLRSPIIYRETGPCAQMLREAIPRWFSPIGGVHHYFKLASNSVEPLLNQSSYSVKKFLYVLRPLLCCHWIDLTRTMPPTEIFPMLDMDGIPCAVKDEIKTLIVTKKELNEREQVTVSAKLHRFTLDFYKQMEQVVENSVKEYDAFQKADVESMDDLFWMLVNADNG